LSGFTARPREKESAAVSIGAFTDQARVPSAKDLKASLGSKLPVWEDLARCGEEICRREGEWKFYGKNYGWALRYRKAGKALMSLYPGRNGLTVQVVLTEKQVARARALGLSERVRTLMEAAHPYPEGRWLFILITSRRGADEVKRLLAVKSGSPG
jgi:hypothetical protein